MKDSTADECGFRFAPIFPALVSFASVTHLKHTTGRPSGLHKRLTNTYGLEVTDALSNPIAACTKTDPLLETGQEVDIDVVVTKRIAKHPSDLAKPRLVSHWSVAIDSNAAETHQRSVETKY